MVALWTVFPIVRWTAIQTVIWTVSFHKTQSTGFNKSDYFVYSLSILSSSVFFEGILPEPRSYVILLSISGYFIAPKLGNQVEIYLSG